ncbi:hypothetical protein JCM8097_008955 [Rhodosporidiobolus ruineniae]
MSSPTAPASLSRRPPPPPSPSPSPTSPSRSRSKLRIFLTLFLGTLYALAALRFNLPPHSWIERWANRGLSEKEMRVLSSRPGFRGVERYSPQHRFRPAASPILTEPVRVPRQKPRGGEL